MLDVDRRSFVAGMGMTTLPVSVSAMAQPHVLFADIGDFLGERLRLSAATASAMMSRALRFTGTTGAVLVGSSDGTQVELSHDTAHRGSWLLRGVPASDAILADAVAFACPRATEQLFRPGVSFRWFSGCSFGGATAHLFRGNKSALFLVTRGSPAAAQPKRLDVVVA